MCRCEHDRRKFRSEIIWTDEKHSQEEAEPGRNSDVEKVRREKIRDGESQKGEDAGARKHREVTVFFQCFVVPEGREVGL